ncbi:hypothetical protein HK096_006364, partial [Nowakowskiella sp. JEL0078]
MTILPNLTDIIFKVIKQQSNEIGIPATCGIAVLQHLITWDDEEHIAMFADWSDGSIMVVNQRDATVVRNTKSNNWAPLLDAKLADIYCDSHDSLFMACGAAVGGSIREARSGIPVILESENDDFAGISGLWSLKLNRESENDSFLVMSFVGATRILLLSEMFDVSDSCGFDINVETILSSNIFEFECHIQIHNRGIILLRLENSEDPNPILISSNLHQWSTDENDRISLASVSVCLEIVEIISVKALYKLLNVMQESVSTGNISVIDTIFCFKRHFKFNLRKNFIIPESIYLLELYSESGFPVKTVLLAGIRDGTLLKYDVDFENDLNPQLTNCKIKKIGSSPCHLIEPRSSNSYLSILALSHRSREIKISPEIFEIETILFPQAHHAVYFTYANKVKSMFMATSTSLAFIELENEKRISMRTAHLGVTPRRILHDDETGLLIVAAASGRSPTLNHGANELLIVNPIDWRMLYRHVFRCPTEIVLSLLIWNVKPGTRYVCVGTAGYRSERQLSNEQRISCGRVLVFNLKLNEDEK